MLSDWIYFRLVHTLDAFLWGGELIGEENLPDQGPAVIIANHLDALGPIAISCAIPLRLCPWSVGHMLDETLAADYLNNDFVERQLHLKPPFSLWISKLLSKITVPMLRSLGCIPVWRGNYESMADTFRLSVDVLLNGNVLLIFPEDNQLPCDPVLRMSPFQHTFVRVGEYYFERTGLRLSFYPVTIHPKRYVQVGKPVLHNPLAHAGHERTRLKNIMEDTIHDMYLKLNSSGVDSVLTPERK